MNYLAILATTTAALRQPCRIVSPVGRKASKTVPALPPSLSSTFPPPFLQPQPHLVRYSGAVGQTLLSSFEKELRARASSGKYPYRFRKRIYDRLVVLEFEVVRLQHSYESYLGFVNAKKSTGAGLGSVAKRNVVRSWGHCLGFQRVARQIAKLLISRIWLVSSMSFRAANLLGSLPKRQIYYDRLKKATYLNPSNT